MFGSLDTEYIMENTKYIVHQHNQNESSNRFIQKIINLMLMISEILFLNLFPRADLVREEPMTAQNWAFTDHKPGP